MSELICLLNIVERVREKLVSWENLPCVSHVQVMERFIELEVSQTVYCIHMQQAGFSIMRFVCASNLAKI